MDYFHSACFLFYFTPAPYVQYFDVLTDSQIKKGICVISVPSSLQLPPSTQVSQSFLDSKSPINLDNIGDNPSKILRVLDVISYQGGGEHPMMPLTTEGQVSGAGEAGQTKPPVGGSTGPALTSPRLIISVHPVPHVTPGAPGPALVCGDQAAPQALTPGRGLHS